MMTRLAEQQMAVVVIVSVSADFPSAVKAVMIYAHSIYKLSIEICIRYIS
jgi:hypothetical protein